MLIRGGCNAHLVTDQGSTALAAATKIHMVAAILAETKVSHPSPAVAP